MDTNNGLKHKKIIIEFSNSVFAIVRPFRFFFTFDKEGKYMIERNSVFIYNQMEKGLSTKKVLQNLHSGPQK